MMRLLVFCLTMALMFVLVPRQSSAAGRDAALQQALGSQAPLYKFSPRALAAAVKQCASRDPGNAGDYIVLILNSGRNDADAIAPSLVTAAIQGLGPDPLSRDIAAIVQAAVQKAPSEVLDIVTASVKASPPSAAPAIVSAAVRSVPHPEQMVTVNVQRRAERIASSDKQTGKELDGKSLGAEQKQLTLAEAIVQAAMDADPGLSEEELTTAVDSGLTATIAVNGPPVLNVVLPPVPPMLPYAPPGGGGGGGLFAAPGPVSP